MLYFFHHYELPAILQQERIQQIVTNQQNNQGTQTQIGNNAQPDANPELAMRAFYSVIIMLMK